MADLITLSEYREALGLQPGDDTERDPQRTQAKSWASDAVRAFTERDFGTDQVTETRIFDYDDSGYIDVDDAEEITTVALVQSNYPDVTLTDDEWAAGPTRRDDSPVYYWIELLGGRALRGHSPEMGFARNLDVLSREGRLWAFKTKVHVTADWGWPEVPGDVKQATVWIAEALRANPEPFTSQAIAGYSRTIGYAAREAIPQRAMALLSRYTKIKV
jgi:hypothetical protein